MTWIARFWVGPAPPRAYEAAEQAGAIIAKAMRCPSTHCWWGGSDHFVGVTLR